MNREARVMYVGAGLSGRATSLAHVCRSYGVSQLASAPSETRIALSLDGQQWEVMASVSAFRAWLWHEDPSAPDLDARLVTELDRLATCDGFIFVIDARRERAEASLEALEVLERDMASRGAQLRDVPIVFQANRLDAPNAHPMSWVRAAFSAHGAQHFESHANEGVGTVQVFEALLRQIRDKTEA